MEARCSLRIGTLRVQIRREGPRSSSGRRASPAGAATVLSPALLSMAQWPGVCLNAVMATHAHEDGRVPECQLSLFDGATPGLATRGTETGQPTLSIEERRALRQAVPLVGILLKKAKEVPSAWPDPHGPDRTGRFHRPWRMRHRPELHEAPVAVQIERIIEEFEPRIPPGDWQRIGGFVRQAVADARPATGPRARHLMGTVAALVRWSWRTAGLPLDRQVVFSASVIEEFVTVTLRGAGGGSAATIRSSLYFVSRRLLKEGSAVPPRMNPLGRSDPSPPYSDSDLVRMRHWADAQRMASRRNDANVLLACCAGAGLRHEELCALRAGEVTIDSEGVLIEIGGSRPRQVPVLEAWESRFSELVAFVGGPDRLLFRPNRITTGHNTVGNFVQHCSSTPVRPTVQRLRSTWIVHHLRAGTPVAALVEAAGVDRLEAFSRYLRFVPGIEARDLRAALRMGGLP